MTAAKIVIGVAAFGLVSLALAIGGVVADHVFPRIPAVERYIKQLPLGKEERSSD